MEILEDVLPIHLWEEAEKQAKRSTLKNYKTGAVIFNNSSYEILSKGCSHIPDNESVRSTHAEQHALMNRGFGSRNSQRIDSILVLCLNPSGNFSYSARPCEMCAVLCHQKDIKYIYYLERDNTGSWECNIETPLQLLNRRDISHTRYSYYSQTRYAKEMRI